MTIFFAGTIAICSSIVLSDTSRMDSASDPSRSMAASIADSTAARNVDPDAPVDLGIEAGETCGPPWLHLAGYSIWSSFFPIVSPRFGLAPTIGSLGARPGWPGWSLRLSYSLASTQPGIGQSITLPAFGAGGFSISVRQRAGRADARGDLGVALELGRQAAPARPPGVRLETGLTIRRYYILTSAPAGAWSPGQVAWWTLDLRAGLGRSRGARLETGFRFERGARFLGGEFAFEKAMAGVVLGCQRAQAWFRCGTISGLPPPQDEFDLALDGPLLTSPAWRDRGSRLISAGAEVNAPVGANMRALAFASYGVIGDPSRAAAEIGVGLAVPIASDRPLLGWKLRLDAPWLRIDPGTGASLDPGRWAFRVLLAVDPAEGPRAPLLDFRYAP